MGERHVNLVMGDLHGEWGRFSKLNFPGVEELREGDRIFCAGDFGFVSRTNPKKMLVLDWLETCPFEILFVDGNHEDFAAISSFPEEEWHGGRVHRIRKNIRHLMRGQVYDIDGKKLFTMGGAYTREAPKEGEMPSPKEYAEARRNLEKAEYRIDYVLSHAVAEQVMTILHRNHQEEKELNFFLEEVRTRTEPERHYAGHLHQDRQMRRGEYILHYDIRHLESGELWIGAGYLE